jgi:hypothetical protein
VKENMEETKETPIHTERLKRRGIGIRKKTLVGVLVVLVACTLVASGALLTHYGQVTTEANVLQSVVISDDSGATWNNYNEGVTTQIDEMVHCTAYWNKYWIKNQACAEAPVNFQVDWLAAPGGDPTGYEYANYIIGGEQTITLRNKEIVWGTSPWEVTGVAGMNITILNCNKGFRYKLDYWNVDSGTYKLIYYINGDQYWDAGPVVVLDTIEITATNGGSFGWKSVGGVQSFPDVNDENAQRPISDVNENYDHQYGAKLWIIPEGALTGDEVDWDMASQFFFETDLALFVNCYLEPTPILNVYDAFTTTTLQPGTTYCWLNYNYVPINIMPGIYRYRTRLVPVQ